MEIFFFINLIKVYQAASVMAVSRSLLQVAAAALPGRLSLATTATSKLNHSVAREERPNEWRNQDQLTYACSTSILFTFIHFYSAALFLD